MEEKLKKIANTIRVKMEAMSHKNIEITALGLPKGISTYLQNYGYSTAQKVFQMKEEDLINLTKCEEVLNSLHDIGIYFVWEELEDLKKDNILTINEIGLINREKGALSKSNITTIVELEMFIRTEIISLIDGIGRKLLKSITEKYSNYMNYMKQCDEKTYNEIIVISNEIEAIIQEKGSNLGRRRFDNVGRIKESEKIDDDDYETQESQTESADKDLITVFREVFGKTDGDEELELKVIIGALLERKSILERERVAYGRLTKQQEKELRSIDSIKNWEK